VPKARATVPSSVATKARKKTTHTTVRKIAHALPAPAPNTAVFDAGDHAAIAQIAYRNWQARGDSPGSAEDDWFRAETEFRASHRS
jgi:hypothetical protein